MGPVDIGHLGKEIDVCRHERGPGGGVGVCGRAREPEWDAAYVVATSM